MAFRLQGYAAIFGAQTVDGDVLMHGALDEFLASPDHLAIPMCYAHKRHKVIGHWLEMTLDKRGLWVRGELTNPRMMVEWPVALSLGTKQEMKGLYSEDGKVRQIFWHWPDEISLGGTPKIPGCWAMQCF